MSRRPLGSRGRAETELLRIRILEPKDLLLSKPRAFDLLESEAGDFNGGVPRRRRLTVTPAPVRVVSDTTRTP